MMDLHDAERKLADIITSGHGDYSSVTLASDLLDLARELDGKVKELQDAIEKFLLDIQHVPPWESAGSIWGAKIKELHGKWLESNPKGS